MEENVNMLWMGKNGGRERGIYREDWRPKKVDVLGWKKCKILYILIPFTDSGVV